MMNELLYDDPKQRLAKRIATRLLIKTPTFKNKHSAYKAGADNPENTGAETVVRFSDVVLAFADWLQGAASDELISRLVGGSEALAEELAEMAAEEIAKLTVENSDLVRDLREARQEWDQASTRANENFAAFEDERNRVAAFKDALEKTTALQEKAAADAAKVLKNVQATQDVNEKLLGLLHSVLTIVETEGLCGNLSEDLETIVQQTRKLMAGLSSCKPSSANCNVNDDSEEWMHALERANQEYAVFVSKLKINPGAPH